MVARKRLPSGEHRRPACRLRRLAANLHADGACRNLHASPRTKEQFHSPPTEAAPWIAPHFLVARTFGEPPNATGEPPVLPRIRCRVFGLMALTLQSGECNALEKATLREKENRAHRRRHQERGAIKRAEHIIHHRVIAPGITDIANLDHARFARRERVAGREPAEKTRHRGAEQKNF